MKPLPPTIKTAMIELLAATDAVFTPFRGTFETEMAGAAIFERRYLYPRHGVRTIAGGADGSIRRAGNRAFAGLVSRGLAQCVGRGRERGVLLTPHGDDYARRMTAGFMAVDSFGLLAWIDGLAAEGQHNDQFVSESDVLGRDHDAMQSKGLAMLEHKALPLLARGWLESQTDYGSRVGYRVTPTGKAATRPEVGELPEFNHEAGEAYDGLYFSALKDRGSWQPSRHGVLWIPLSAGNWPSRRGATTDG